MQLHMVQFHYCGRKIEHTEVLNKNKTTVSQKMTGKLTSSQSEKKGIISSLHPSAIPLRPPRRRTPRTTGVSQHPTQKVFVT